MNIGLESFQRAVVGKKIEMVSALTKAIEARDEYTRWHSSRVADYSCRIGRELALAEKELQCLYWAATVHDIGKIGIPEAILHKRTPLTAEEYRVIQRHPAIGVEILKPVGSLRALLPLVYHHHEHFDGSGYPEQLRGAEIPLASRIIAVADAFEAMSSDRCYRRRLAGQAILDELYVRSGSQFDPQVVAALLDLIADNRLSLDEPVLDYAI